MTVERSEFVWQSMLQSLLAAHRHMNINHAFTAGDHVERAIYALWDQHREELMDRQPSDEGDSDE